MVYIRESKSIFFVSVMANLNRTAGHTQEKACWKAGVQGVFTEFCTQEGRFTNFFAENTNLWLTIAGRYGIIISVAGKHPGVNTWNVRP